ncbi:TPA: DUF551 domain-containing protein [Raoultella planticola]
MTSKLTRDIIQSEIADFFAGVVEIHTELGGPNSVEEAQNQLTERVLACVPAVDSEPVAYIDKQWTLVYYVPPMSMGLKIGDKLYRHAQQPVGNEFIPKNLDRALGVLGMALPESKEEFNLQSERWIQRLIDRVIRYADEFKEQPAPVVPAEWTIADAVKFCLETGRQDAGAAMDAWNACRAATLQAGNSPAHSGLRPEQIGVSPAQDHGWIPVSERMPDDEQEVIVQTHSGWRYVSFYDAHSRLFFDSPDGDIEHILVTHWMPLPAAPQEAK